MLLASFGSGLAAYRLVHHVVVHWLQRCLASSCCTKSSMLGMLRCARSSAWHRMVGVLASQQYKKERRAVLAGNHNSYTSTVALPAFRHTSHATARFLRRCGGGCVRTGMPSAAWTRLRCAAAAAPPAEATTMTCPAAAQVPHTFERLRLPAARVPVGADDPAMRASYLAMQLGYQAARPLRRRVQCRQNPVANAVCALARYRAFSTAWPGCRGAAASAAAAAAAAAGPAAAAAAAAAAAPPPAAAAGAPSRCSDCRRHSSR
jgi:hypothetical protein